jgi:predicted ATPase
MVAQLGATIGREFSYALIAAIALLDVTTLDEGLRQLVESELIYQRGLPPDAQYQFKHALIQDTAYESLLKRTRQQCHHQIAQVLEQQFAEVVATQPELLAQHYTDAGLPGQALPYWQQAGHRAVERSANAEAISHLNAGLALLQALPASRERVQQELQFRLALGPPLMATHGIGSVELARSFGRTRELCQQLGDPPELFPVLYGLAMYHQGRAEHQAMQALSEQLMALAEQGDDSTLLMQAHVAQGACSMNQGRLVAGREHCELGLALYDPAVHWTLADLYGFDPGIVSAQLAMTLWLLGYPDQAMQRANEAVKLSHDRTHPMSVSLACMVTGMTHRWRGETVASLRQAEALLVVSQEHDLAAFVGGGHLLAGWVRAEQGKEVEGVTQMRQGLQLLADKQALSLPCWMSLLIDTYWRTGQGAEGLALVEEALGLVNRTEERYYEAELHRLQGELLLQRSPHEPSAGEVAFAKALEVAREQEAKSLELRAAMSLARLWRQQGKTPEARALLAPVYEWFTEGFATADLQDAKALLSALTGEK